MNRRARLAQLWRLLTRRGYPWESAIDQIGAAEYSDAVKFANSRKPSTYIGQARVALRDALPLMLDMAGMKWDPADDPQLFDLYVLLVLTAGESTTLEQVHDAWAVHTQHTRPDHRDLVPFHCLAENVADYDRPFRDAIRMAALTLRIRDAEGGHYHA